jgi:hypothetical protein
MKENGGISEIIEEDDLEDEALIILKYKYTVYKIMKTTCS